ARFSDRAGAAIVAASILLFAASIFITVRWLGFDPDRNNLIGATESYNRAYDAFKKEFPGEDDIVVVIQGQKPETNRQAVNRLGQVLRADPTRFTDVYDKIDLGF